MSNSFQKTSGLSCSLSRLLISLFATGVLVAIATGCGNAAPISTDQGISEGTATPNPTLVPNPTLAAEPTSQPTSISSKEDESALVRALEDNASLKNTLSALKQELKLQNQNPSAAAEIAFVEESDLKRLREGRPPADLISEATGLISETAGIYSEFIRGEIERLKSEVKRLEESDLDYDYAFPESGFPMERKEDILVLAADLRESVVIIETSGGGGTGFVIGDDLVVTNNHVISDAYDNVEGVVIRTFAGEDFNAELVGTDPVWDIALLRSDRPLGSPSLTWGDSRKLNPNDGVFAIGHPGQMGNWALTGGIFVQSTTQPLDFESAEYGEVSEGDPETRTVTQTSVPSMSGSSGSPLFNMNGEVIAVLWGSEGLETLTDVEGIGSLGSPVPHRIHSQPAVVSREWTSGSPAWKAQEFIEEWLTVKS